MNAILWAALRIGLGLSIVHSTASHARAQPEQNSVFVELTSEGDQIFAAFSIEEVFGDSFRKRVLGGLESRVEIQTQLVDRQGAVVGTGRRSCKLLYLLWDETLYTSVEDNGRSQPYVGKFQEIGPALTACGHVTNLPVALAGTLTLAEGYRLRVNVILNPVSKELVERSRQFVSNPRGVRSGSSKNLLSTIAGLFGRQGGALGDLFELESQPLQRPARPTLAPASKKGEHP